MMWMHISGSLFRKPVKPFFKANTNVQLRNL